MLQKIGEICSILSFIYVGCSILFNGPEWPRNLFLIIGIICIIFVIIYEIYRRKNRPYKKKISEEEGDKSSTDKKILAFQEVINNIDILLKNKKRDKALFAEVKTTAKNLIIDNFGKNTSYYTDYCNIRYKTYIYRGNFKKAARDAYVEGLGKLKGLMKSCIYYYNNQ